ncbi:MAG: hypothetical protein AAFZ38_04685, partial [Myxococcota bacterium]
EGWWGSGPDLCRDPRPAVYGAGQLVYETEQSETKNSSFGRCRLRGDRKRAAVAVEKTSANAQQSASA